MVGGAKGDEWLPGVDVFYDHFLLVHRQGEHPGEKDHQIGRCQPLKARDVMRLEHGTFFGVDRLGGIDLALVIHSEEHGAVETMVGAENLRHHRHGLLTAVFLLRSD